MRAASAVRRSLGVPRRLVLAGLPLERPLAELLRLAADLAREGEPLERAISCSPSRRAGSAGGSGAISLRIRLRSWSAKCGVEAPMSWRTSSTVTWCSGRRRSGCSASAMPRIFDPAPGYRLDLEQGVDARLDVDRDRVLVAHHPAVVVDAATGSSS